MRSHIVFPLLCVLVFLFCSKSCAADLTPLFLYSPGQLEYTDVIVKTVNDSLTLVCEVRGEGGPRMYVWNYVLTDGSGNSAYTVTANANGNSSTLRKRALRPEDSGQAVCSAPPFSATKYILVQPPRPNVCALGAFRCDARCVLPSYVCDGRPDCARAEDEAPALCGDSVCNRSNRLNCSDGRCIHEAACCRPGDVLCKQPSCCGEHAQYSTLQAFVDVEFPPLHEDRRAPDDYGFIQSTIYTVTACALIFMIAVVLLVSAICKMHMKRAALRSYGRAERDTRARYTLHLAQAQRFPPCYEASRLLEQSRAAPDPAQVQFPERPDPVPTVDPDARCGLARLSAIFSSRYRQVPSQCADVEMTSVRPASLQSSPSRAPLDDYRSPTFCDINSAEFIFTDQEAVECSRDLNYMATPVDVFRRRNMRRNTLERIMNQLERQRLTLQLGRFQFSIPRFGRRSSAEPRPDTPNVAEINIDDLDFVRLNSNDTYTLNGRTIRLLGANFENYPVMADGSVRPPSYSEAVRYKLHGPPPEYLSREGLNTASERVDQEARNNVEMPPCYEDLASGVDTNATTSRNDEQLFSDNGNVTEAVITETSNGNGPTAVGVADADGVNGNNVISRSVSQDSDNLNGNFETISSVIDNLPAIDSDVNANDSAESVRA